MISFERLKICNEVISIYERDGRKGALKLVKSYGIPEGTLHGWLYRGIKPNPNLSYEGRSGFRCIDLSSSPELSYILGVMMGDGWTTKSDKYYFVALETIDKDFGDRFKSALFKIGLNPCSFIRIRKDRKNRKPIMRIQAHSKKFYEWYNPLSLEIIQKIVNPHWMDFIRGFHDSEGDNQGRISNTDISKIHLVKDIISQNGYGTLPIRKREQRGSFGMGKYTIYVMTIPKQVREICRISN